MDSWFGNTSHDDVRPRRSRRQRVETRKRRATALIASLSVGALLAIGLPMTAFAEQTAEPAPDAATTSETQEETSSDETTTETPSSEAPASEAPASETPASEAPASEEPTDAPTDAPAKEAPSDPPAQAPPAEELQAPLEITPMAIFPADTADCTTNCGNLTITNVVSGGSATAGQWTLHAVRSSNSDNYNFTSGQTRPVPRNTTYTLFADSGPANYTTTFTCTTGGSGQGDPSFDAAARTVTFTNTNGNPTQKFADCTFTQTYSGPATINVQVGGSRNGISSVAGLGGVTLQLYTDNGGSFGSVINQPWATCVSTPAGVCTFTVPNANNSNFWVAQAVPGVPSGWSANDTLAVGETPASAAYRFRIADVDAGETLSSLSDFMIATGNSANNASGGIWQNSLANPTRAQQCGVRIALVIDLSGSVAPNFTDLKNAAKGFVTALQGTPSQVGIFTFNNVAPATAGSNLGITPVSTVAGANTVRNHIDTFTTPTEATNWDRGLYQVAASGTQYDIALVLTDGNPTVYANDEGPGNRTRFREVENGVFSANAVKALGTRVIAFGVGSGVGGSPDNLVAISGDQLNSDYFQSSSYDQAGQILRDLALGACQGSISVVKQVVSSSSTGEQKTGQTPAGGWTFTAAPTTGGITPASQQGVTAPGTGAVNLPLTFAGGTTSGTVKVTEDPQGHSIVQTGGKNAVCTDQATGSAITVSNEADGFSIPVSSTQAVTCNVWNRPPLPQSNFSVNKVWVVNGTTYQHGNQPSGLTAQLTVGGANAPWVTTQGPLPANTVVALNETTGVGTRDLCTITDRKVTLANGQVPADGSLPFSPTLQPGNNTYTITNTVTCDSQLTLKKTVTNGGVAANTWTLDAVAPGGALAGPNGTTGSAGATALVTPNVTYPLAESGDPRYVQTLGLNAVPIPGSTGSWDCVQVNAQGVVVPGFADGLNGGVTVPLGFRVQCTAVNQTAQLTLVKSVQELDGTDAEPGDWNLIATPSGSIPGLGPVQTTSGNTVLVRPGTSYTISETGGPAGYEQLSIQCKTSPGGEFVTTTTITLPALAQGTCVITNKPIPPQLKLTKVVTGDVALPTSWNLAAKVGAVIVAQGDGGTGGFVDVPAGETLALSESTALPNADQFEAGTWLCSKNGGAAVPGPSVPPLAPGDKVDCTVTNTLKAITPTIVKTAAVPTPSADGVTWNIGYDIVVTNPSAFQDLTYSLTDQLVFGSNVTVNSASYQRTLPAPPGSSTAWTVAFGNVQSFVGEPTLAKGTSHTWHVTVNATVAPGTDFSGTSPTACDAGTPGTVGFLNTAVMTVGGVDYEAQDCSLPVKPTIAKVGGTAVDNGDGTWTLPYTITVTNPSASTGVVYDLRDTLALPASATQVGLPTVVSKPAGVTTEAGWTGAVPNDLLANDIALAGGAAAHVYQIAVVVRLDAGDPAYTCPSGGGLNNTATLVSGNQTTDATGCVVVNPPVISHTKTVVPGSVSQGSDGTWTIAYDLVVTNTGPVGGVYTLADVLHFGTGVDLGTATYAVTKDGAPYVTPWAGSGNIAVDAYLATGTATTYRITVAGIALDGPDLTPAQSACPGGSSNGSFNNTATLTVAGVTTDKSACDSPSAPKIVKSGATSSQRLDGTWDVTYTLTVSNTDPGAKPSYYTLADDPAFPAGVVYLSYAIDGGAPVSPYDGSAFTVASNTAIPAGETDVYTVVLNVDAPVGDIEPAELECASENNPDGVGFLNEAIVTSGEIVRTDDDCTNISRGGEPTVVKDDPTITQDGDGLWTIVYDVTVTGNSEFVSKYTLDDTLRFGPEVDIQSASWTGEGDDDTWTDPEADPTTEIVSSPKVIGIDEVQTYTVTVTAKVGAAAFGDPTTNTCAPTDGEPNVGFLNEAALTANGITSTDTGCGLPAQPEVVKSTDGVVTKVGDHWEASYTITVENLSSTQELLYDLTDTPDFAGDVTITDREVTSADVTVNPAWNGADSATDVVVEDETLPGGATHTFSVFVSFTVEDADSSAELLCDGDGGKGLLNGAAVTSGDTYTDDACFDVPVVVVLEKLWTINGDTPIAWDSASLPDGFTAQATLDGQDVLWGAEQGPYTDGDEVLVGESDVLVPEGCVLGNATGLGAQTLAGTVTTLTVTNPVTCTQTVDLEKHVDNLYGGAAVPADWAVSGTNVGDDTDTFTGDGTASGSVELGVGYTLNEVSTVYENGKEYTVSSTWSCTSEQGADAFTLVSAPGSTSATLTVTEYGATVECEITNTDVAPKLTLVKKVMPLEIAPDYPATLWTLAAADGANPPVVTGDGTATGTVESNLAYTLSEAADFAGDDEFTASLWNCVSTNGVAPLVLDAADGDVALQPGQEVTCEITNTAAPATYRLDKEVVSTVQNADGTWTIEYKITVTDESVVSAVTYDLSDTLADFGEGITIDEATWTGPGGTSGNWADPSADPVEELADNVILTAGEGFHEYFVTVDATVTEDAWDDETVECTEGEGGFRNTAILTVGDLPTEATACDEPGRATAVKTVDGAPIDNLDGTWTVNYDVVVTADPDKDLTYDLSDEPAFPAGATFTATAEDPNGDPVAGWTGTGDDTVLADGRPILAGIDQIWHIQAIVDVTEITDIDLAKCVETESGHGFFNGALFTNGQIETPISGCVDIPIVDVGIVKTAVLPEGVDAVDAGTDENTFEWVLTVTNNGPTSVEGAVVTDTLPDSLEFDVDEVTYDSTGTWTFVKDGNKLTATSDSTFGSGPMATITIPVTLTAPAVGPELPENPAEVPPLVPAENIENTACVEVDEFDIDPTNDCDTADVPTKAMQANAYVQCVNDVPYLYHNVQTTGSVTPGPITVTWTPDAGVYPDATPIVMEIPWEERNGRTLWPYGVVNDEGISIGWPGWRLIEEGDVVGENGIVDIWENMVKDSKLESYAFADQFNPMTITFQVNPSESVLAVYPQATPACEVQRDPTVEILKTSSVTEAKPGSSFDYTLSVTNSGLGAVEAVELFDEIPGDLKVTEITTDPAPAFPRWDDCEVTGKDSAGYGGTLHCVLNGMIGGTQPDAPDVVLAVTLNPASKQSSIDNTGEVCWNDLADPAPTPEVAPQDVAVLSAIDPELPVLCDDSTVTVKIPQAGAIASTGFAGAPLLWGAGGLLAAGALLIAAMMIRRRRAGESAE
ncbi:VWA domain-containing protein [Agromyces cerinus]|uniref:Conserved repeat domain-containing protein n=1 Tax=Agromyces cerinus subsp. cerinus TaxID=232089 RepID=A0A1N6DGT2_9MICO|nr:VWA domain-containing protein [Agromyces cerinus]SIN70029.1 conserved repeat domain-containing protein [Agromyces cerinus subsp. cerinus]